MAETADYRAPAVLDLELDGCKLLCPSVHREPRGEILSLYNEHYRGRFVEDKLSRSPRHVLRGFHGDFVTTKLLSCLAGQIHFVIADCRRTSATFGRWQSLTLSDHDRWQVLIPPGVFNAHYCLSENCLFWYKLSRPYAGQASQLAFRWDSFPDAWPATTPILAARDAAAPRWDEINWIGYRSGVTVAVSGYFNPLHRGHLDLIEAAARLGDELVVIVNNDTQVRLKGSRPFMAEDERLRVVAALKWVDRAVLAEDDDRSVCRTLERLRPDVFANGGDVTADNVREAETCRRLGIDMVFGIGGGKTQSSSWLLAAQE